MGGHSRSRADRHRRNRGGFDRRRPRGERRRSHDHDRSLDDHRAANNNRGANNYRGDHYDNGTDDHNGSATSADYHDGSAAAPNNRTATPGVRRVPLFVQPVRAHRQRRRLRRWERQWTGLYRDRPSHRPGRIRSRQRRGRRRLRIARLPMWRAITVAVLATTPLQACVTASGDTSETRDDCHPSYDPCVPSASDVDCLGGLSDSVCNGCDPRVRDRGSRAGEDHDHVYDFF
jgi:hypothetical protein